MSKLPNRTEQNSSNISRAENRVIEENLKRRQQEQRLKILDANNRITLLKVLNKFKINPERKYKNAWSLHLKCPLPSHKDGKEGTPSFGYNFEDDRFNCFGCNKSGRAVEFIHNLKNLPKIVIAENIISNYPKIEGKNIFDNKDIYLELDSKLFSFSNNVNKIIQKNKHNPDALVKIEQVLNWFDIFIVKKVHSDNYSVEDLEERIHKAMEIISTYG